MMIPSSHEAYELIKRMLADFLQVKDSDIVHEPIKVSKVSLEPDLILSLQDVVFIVEYKETGKAAAVENGIRQLKTFDFPEGNYVNLLVVPYMHKFGRDRCRREDISWFDLSGNADISGHGIRILITDKKNLFHKPGRSTGVFARKSSRVSRMLLYNPEASFTQRELSVKTNLDEGYISKIVHSLEEDELVYRLNDGSVKVRDKRLLLEAWWEVYDFHKHTIIMGHIPARSGLSLVRTVSEELSSHDIKYAATGLAGAWLYTKYADFRIGTIYLNESLPYDILSDLNFADEEQGENVWFVIPRDDWVFFQAQEINGIVCAHPIQVFLDLKDHPERAEEAADQLRSHIFS